MSRSRSRRRLKSICCHVAAWLGALFALLWYRSHRPQPAPLRKTLYPGMVYTREVRASPHPLVAHVVAIDLSTPGLRFLVTPGDSAHKLSLRARTTLQFAREFRVQLAINGDFFYPWHSTSPWDYYPHVGEPCETEGRAASQGMVYGLERYKRVFPTLFLSRDNRATFNDLSVPIWNALSGDRIFLRNGRFLPDEEPYHIQRQPRTAVALTADRRTLLLILVDGRQPGYSDGASLEELADIVRAHGGDTALNLDGGGSTELVAENPQTQELEILNSPIDNYIPGRERPVANHLGIYAR